MARSGLYALKDGMKEGAIEEIVCDDEKSQGNNGVGVDDTMVSGRGEYDEYHGDHGDECEDEYDEYEDDDYEEAFFFWPSNDYDANTDSNPNSNWRIMKMSLKKKKKAPQRHLSDHTSSPPPPQPPAHTHLP